MLVTGLLPFSRGAQVLLGTPQGYRGEGVVPRFWELVERHKINFFSGVPTVYAALLQQPIEGRDFGSLEYGLCGAAPMPVELMRNFETRPASGFWRAMARPKATCVSSCNPPLGERRLGSIGLRLPLQAMKPVCSTTQAGTCATVATVKPGSADPRGLNVFTGYKVPEHNKGLWLRCRRGARWLNTGDLGRQDAEGYFYLTGRKKELIIRGGHNIDPAAIEEPLHGHPAVQLVQQSADPMRTRARWRWPTCS